MTRLSKLSRSIAGKVAIVTGSASGMGRATAHLFADEGAHVAVTDINGDGVDAVVAEITEAGLSAKGWTLDLANPERIKVVITEVVDHFSGIDISSAGDLQGTFSYTDSLEMLDPTVDMLKETLHKVQNLHGVFKDYYLRASQKRYNQVAKKFDEDFVIEFENKMKANITDTTRCGHD
mgnify:CR=1 FL=1